MPIVNYLRAHHGVGQVLGWLSIILIFTSPARAQHECNTAPKKFAVAFTCSVDEPQKCREAKLSDAEKRGWFCQCPLGQTGCVFGAADLKSGPKVPKDTEIEVFVPGQAAPAPGACKIKTVNDTFSDKPVDLDEANFKQAAGAAPPCPQIKTPANLKVIIKHYESKCSGACVS